MRLSKFLLGLLLCSAAFCASPITTLTAGLFTFSNIALTGTGADDITWSVSTQSTSEYGGISSITFSDNGATVGLSGSLQFSYDVMYSGTDPGPGYLPGYYLASFSETYGSLGQEIGSTSLSYLANTYQGGSFSFGGLNDTTASVYIFGQSFTSF